VRAERAARDAWYGQPILWLGAVLLAATLAVTAAMIALGLRHGDTPLPTVDGPKILKVPLAHDDDAGADTEAARQPR